MSRLFRFSFIAASIGLLFLFFVPACNGMALPANTLHGKMISLTINPPSIMIQTDSVRITKVWVQGTTVFEDATGKTMTPNAFSVIFGGKYIALVLNDFEAVIRMYPINS